MPDRDGALIVLLAVAAGIAMGWATLLAGAPRWSAWVACIATAGLVAVLEDRRPPAP